MAKIKKRLKAVDGLFRKFEDEPSHAKQVKKLALQLFDDLESLHGLGERERQWLEAAALLHDIGWSQGGKSHHKKSMKLILAQRFDGWTEDEQLVVANIARYHRKSSPKLKHKKFAALPPASQRAVRKLAAILRIADGLDRSHGSVIEKIKCRLEPDHVAVTLVCQRDLHSELYGFDKKKDLFEETFGLLIAIENVANFWEFAGEAEKNH